MRGFCARMIEYDFVYYLTHRFLFHGLILLKVHALHHRAHHPTYIDTFYVHPLETFIGIALFKGAVFALGADIGPDRSMRSRSLPRTWRSRN